MKLLFDIFGKIVLVMGGLSGIGVMIVCGFVENGVKIYILVCKEDWFKVKVEELFEIGICILI